MLEITFDLNNIANIIASTAILPVGLFIYFYGTAPTNKWYRRKPSGLWKTTQIGRVLMGQKIAWFIFLLFVIHGLFLDYPGKDIVRIVVYSWLVVQFWVVFHTLRKIQTDKPKTYETTTKIHPLPDEIEETRPPKKK